MRLISPDLLSDASGLSVGAAAFGLFVGLMMWGLGWRWHKFWVVFGVTLTAGLIGMSAGRVAGTSVLVVGVLLALAAGVLALELARIAAFFTCGTAAWLAVQALFPSMQELWAVFLCGGLIGVVLYRLWTMLATSFLGTLLIGHCVLILAETMGVLKASEWAEKNFAVLNGVAITLAVLGVAVQAKTGQEAKAEEKTDEPKVDPKPEPVAIPEKPTPWFRKLLPFNQAA